MNDKTDNIPNSQLTVPTMIAATVLLIFTRCVSSIIKGSANEMVDVIAANTSSKNYIVAKTDPSCLKKQQAILETSGQARSQESGCK